MDAQDRGFCPAVVKKLRWLGWGVVLLLVLAGCSKPFFTHFHSAQEQRWERAVAEEARKVAPSPSSKADAASQAAAPDFGRELDTLTGFYETVISLLLGVLALVAGLAFWTIKVVTKAQAEETAMTEATRILGDHDNFRDRLSNVVKEAVDRQMEEVRAKLERLEDGFVPADLAVNNPNERVPPGDRPK